MALDGGILAPGLINRQVNGGDGLLFNDAPTLATLRRMAAAHVRLGAASILLTLITDTPDKVAAAIVVVAEAVAAGVPCIIGLNLEGPHLALSPKGAHNGALIRAMTAADLAMLRQALPTLLVIVAPESVTPDQIAT